MVRLSDRARQAVRLVVSGRVQGVGFRWWTVAEAKRLGLDGWVRNRREGTVEAVVAGPPDAVGQMIAACRQGPVSARVDDLTVGDATDPGRIGFREEATR